MKVQKGYTILELLIVISIMGILTTIVFSALSDIQGTARDSVRKTHLRQLYSALETYQLSHDGQYPSENWCDSSLGTCASACPCSDADWDYAGAGYIGNQLRTDGYYVDLPLDPINNSSYYYQYEPSCNQGACAGLGCCEYVLQGALEGGGFFVINGGQ